MIQIEIRNGDAIVRGIEQRLGHLYKDAPVVLKLAINETANKTRTLMAKEAQKVYIMKLGSAKKYMKIKKATANKPVAVISSKGSPTLVNDHKISPAKMQTGENRPSILKAKVLRKSKMQSLQRDGIKAFLTKFTNSGLHKVGVVERVGKGRYPIKPIYSPAISQMLGSERNVLNVIQPEVGEILKREITRQIDRRIRREMYVN
ncbi:Prophage minor tail protein Z [anaerobic digester metagenome]